MSGLENLARLIYHEKQQSGSMLCAQHALNSLLQGNYFTAPDLSDIARSLDALEESYDDSNTGNASTNMDDTGFFSVQVLENALKVWGLNLTRWRGENMRPYHDRPHTQLAFILNLEQHWFTLRRFGHAEPNIDNDPGDGHWFNLNSSLPEPEWVGKLYLGMVLQQSETDGYSVFAVTQADPSSHLALPRTDADEIASTLPEPRFASRQNLSSPHTTGASSAAPERSQTVEGLEDEDYELQAALHASMFGGGGTYEPYEEAPPSAPPRLARAPVPLPPASETQSPSSTGVQTPTGEFPFAADGAQSIDAVAASLERNRRMLQQMKAQQEYAQRELWADGASGSDLAAVEARREQRRKEEEEEAEQLRLAIEESEALARRRSESEDDIEDDMDIDAAMPQLRNVDAFSHPVGNRVYDDDDAELQAALKASLEHVPEGWQLPELHERIPTYPPRADLRTDNTDSHTRDREDAESTVSDETSITTDHPPSEAESVSVDELRKRRLARFGV